MLVFSFKKVYPFVESREPEMLPYEFSCRADFDIFLSFSFFFEEPNGGLCLISFSLADLSLSLLEKQFLTACFHDFP